MARRPETISVRDKILHCSTLKYPVDLNDWEQGFIRNMKNNLITYNDSFTISEKQEYCLVKIWMKHFAKAEVLPDISGPQFGSDVLSEGAVVKAGIKNSGLSWAEITEEDKPKPKVLFDSYDDDIPF